MINYWAVLVSAIAAMVIGSIWWGPLFGKMWMQENGFNNMSPEQKAAMKKSMNGMYFQQLILSLIQAAVLACVLNKLGRTGAGEGIKYAALLWLGFLLPTQYGDKLWSNKKLKLVVASLAASLLTLVVMGAIIGAW